MKNERQTQRLQWITLILFLAASYPPLFLHLGSQPLKNFDESFYALRAYRIAEYGEYLYNYSQFPDGPSGTNLKAPLFSGVQALFFKIMGYNELALRLPVALSVWVLLLLMIRLGRRHFHDPAFGYFSALTLLTSWGFVHVHVSRTGEHDAPLAVMGWLALICLYRFLDGERKDRRWLWGLMGALIAATLTKSIAGLFFVPGMLAYTLYKRQFLPLLKDRNLWLAVGGFVLAVGGYYLFREWDHPGFLADVWKGELGGHYLQTRDGHQWPFLWFAERLVRIKYQWWIGWFVFGGLTVFYPRLRAYRDLGILLGLAWWSWLLVISSSQTKLEWYDASLYPLMAMFVGLILSQLYQGLQQVLQLDSGFWKYSLTALFVLVLFLPPYLSILQKTYQPKDNDYPGELYGYLIHQATRTPPQQKEYTLVYRGFSLHCLFYQLVYNEEYDYEISRKRKFEEMEAGETVMLCEPQGLAYAREHFEVENLTATRGCYLMKLVSRRGSP